MSNYQVKNSTAKPVKLFSGGEEFILMPGEIRKLPNIANGKLTFADGVSADITMRRRKAIKNGFSLANKVIKEVYNKVLEISIPDAFNILKIKAIHHLSDGDK